MAIILYIPIWLNSNPAIGETKQEEKTLHSNLVKFKSRLNVPPVFPLLAFTFQSG